ncbi:molybdopterin converting factor subunit 1 [Ferruginivarius sediminum]|jgi:molybdopterin converting factor subunit 1|uniref:Molybdopterin synthase sulfur carrier subunit n=1 Tax=Ferruginivarius sediminum TaxID=2661937 RepID=A0A369TAS5_9PROT|nr:molybdopterin converting factor subunit 1 [Ferruginivarius sediminum]RDD62413.1 molybdopterin converting factor subunit 1 [Ferruginivarius sediminum]
MKVLYFAWLKTKTGVGEEELSPPAGVATVAQLLDWLEARSPGHGEALADRHAIRIAVNQEYARPGDPVKAGDEIALFPPVTGG